MQPLAELRRIPTLDGWRGVAILMVLVDHSLITVFGDGSRSRLPFQGLGLHGVDVFFVLSGFLITSRLLDEARATAGIQLTSFYTRRFLRLMPCAWLYLAVAGILSHFQHTDSFGIIPSLLFFRNYRGSYSLTGHFWTLSIEEQFYLVWPTLLLLARRKAWIIAALGCATVCIWRTLEWNRLEAAHVTQSFLTQYRADALLIGCLLALFLDELRPWLESWLVWPLLASFLGCILVFHKLIPTKESLVIALLIGVTSTNAECWLSRLLQARWLVQIGLISYSVYIWQQLILLHWVGPLYITAPARIAAALIVGYLSYTFVEKPMRHMRGPLPETSPHTAESALTA